MTMVASSVGQMHDFARLIIVALKQCLDPARPYALFDFPHYSNVGDSVIWQAELRLLAAYFGREPVLSCGSLPDSTSLPDLSEATQVILTGGGNLGDLWPHHQRFRERVIQGYLRHRIVQMPQSIFFQDSVNQARCKAVFTAHPGLTLLVRDEPSYEIGRCLHQGQTLLVPDVALAFGSIRRPCAASMPVVALLRADTEKSIADDPVILKRWHVQDWLDEPFYLERKVLIWLQRFPSLFRRFPGLVARLQGWLHRRLSWLRLQRGCHVLSKGHVVITDRLHAHLLCVLMDIPHVVLDNSYGKISSFRRLWTSNPSIRCLEAATLAEADRLATLLLHHTTEGAS